MIRTPYNFSANLSDQEFQKIGEFACCWAHIEHTVGNCLRRMLNMNPKEATIMVFPLSLDQRMTKIGQLLDLAPLSERHAALFGELKPLIRAQQILRTNILHGVFIDIFEEEEPFWHLRSKNRDVSKTEILACEDLINYTAHVVEAFRLLLGDELNPEGLVYALPNRPAIPEFLPKDCRTFPKGDGVEREAPLRSPGS